LSIIALLRGGAPVLNKGVNMGKVSFVFALHNHQPVGNFGHIFKESFDNCYRPFIDELEKHSSVKAVLHYSGPLLDWIEENETNFLDRLNILVEKGQIEVLSGGYYEPLLTLVPEVDAIGQIKKMNEYISKRFSQEPQGFWLTERVWEPTFPSIAAKTGLKFTTLDDSHFQYAGIKGEDIRDFYITENNGDVLFVFPISKFLRYAIPFKLHNHIIDYFREFAARYDHTIITLADDGEKFGVWPGTHQWVYKEKWLAKFFEALEKNADWLETITFSEGLKRRRARGMVYIPTASYEEMMEWVLPPDQNNALQELKHKLEEAKLLDNAHDFIRGGYFRNFFAKYSEANAMKGKQFYVSKKVNALKRGKARDEALNNLWMGECNCPYWHGVFGGLYLHHLRRSTYDCLIKAEECADKASNTVTSEGRIIKSDINFDGVDELLFESDVLNTYCIPHAGGALFEIDYRPCTFNITDTMTKRKEAYHELILKGNKKKNNNSSGVSIHDLKKAVSPEIRENLHYDSHIRRSLIDICIAPEVNFEDFKANKYEDLARFYDCDYGYGIRKRNLAIELEAEADVMTKKGTSLMKIEKVVTFKHSTICVEYTLINKGANKLDFCFGSEWNFNFKSDSRELLSVKEASVQDEWSKLGIICTSEDSFDVWQYEIKTVSQTESEYCLSTQGTSFLPHWHIELQPGEKKAISFQMHVIEK